MLVQKTNRACLWQRSHNTKYSKYNQAAFIFTPLLHMFIAVYCKQNISLV